MRCEEFEARLNQVLDDRRPLSSADDIQAHMRECGGCREIARGYEALLAGIGWQFVPQIPAGLTARVIEELTSVGHERRARLLRFPQRAAVPVLVAASLLLAIGLTWMNHFRRVELDGRAKLVDKEPIAQMQRGSSSDGPQVARTTQNPAHTVNSREDSNVEPNMERPGAVDWAPAGAEWAQDVADGLQPVTQPTVGAINGFLNLWGIGQQGHRS
jgi:hypothetical protein